MKRSFASAALLLLMLTSVVRAQDDGSLDPSKAASFYPLVKNATWKYEAASGMGIVVRVVGPEEKKKFGVDCFKLETSINSMPIDTEHVAVFTEKEAKEGPGIYRIAVSDKKVDPPLCLFKFPAKKNDTWQINSKVGGEQITGTFVYTGTQTIKYKGEDKEAHVVTGKDMAVSGQKMTLTYFYVESLGVVKQVVNIGNVPVELKLTDYREIKE